MRINMFLLMILFTSCTRIFLPVWYNGESDEDKASYAEFEGIRVKAENLSVNDQHMVFDISIHNTSDQIITVVPGRAFIIASGMPFPPDTKTAENADFETQLARKYAFSEQAVEEQLRQKIRAERTTGAILTALSVGLVLFDVAMDARDASTVDWTSRKARASETRDILTAAGLTAMDVAHQKAEMNSNERGEDLYYLGGEALKEAELSAGEITRGKVFFPLCEEKYIRLIIPVGNTDFSFDFRLANPGEYQ